MTPVSPDFSAILRGPWPTAAHVDEPDHPIDPFVPISPGARVWSASNSASPIAESHDLRLRTASACDEARDSCPGQRRVRSFPVASDQPLAAIHEKQEQGARPT